MKRHDIDIELVIEDAVEKVFDAWVNPSQLTRWLAPKAKVEPSEGGAYELYWEPERPEINSTRGCRITEIVPNRELSFSWRGPEEFASLMKDRTAVFLRFETCAEGTRIRLVHTGWGHTAEWEEARLWQTEAWRQAMEQLKDMLENTDKFLETISLN
jgi:uncharacterized protein YndB with AHSA1/START domain